MAPWEDRGGRERGRRMNTVEIMCTRVCKWKMIPVETIPGIGEGGDKGKWWRG
jgi:hypothetical protein